MESKRTQAGRTAATRAALVVAARPLFAEHGYGPVSTDQISQAAGVTRGALYHQFDGKLELFAAVFEQVEEEVAARMGEHLAQWGETDPADLDPRAVIRMGVDAWLEACAEPEVLRIALLEAPTALGWDRWREIGRRYGVGIVELLLTGLVEAGAVAPQPVAPLAHVVVGALEEAALYAARAADPPGATDEVRAALVALLTGLLR